MASATKIFGERFENFYSDCVVKRCACQTTARARTGAQYEARTYGENQALKTRDQSSSLPTYRLECLTCGIATVRRYKADAESRLSLNLHQRNVWQMVCYQWTLKPLTLQMNLLPEQVSGIRLPRLPYLQRSFVTLPSRRTIKPISALLIKRYQWEILTITSPQNQLILCIKAPQKDLCIASKPMFDFRIPKPRKRMASPKPLLTLVLLWIGKGHYRRYFYVRPVQKTVWKENCGRHFLRNTSRTSRIVKKKLTLIMLECNSFEELRFCRFHANVRAKYRGPLLDLWDLPLQNPSTIIPQYVRLTFYLQLMFESPHYICVAVQRVRRPDIANVKSRLQFDLFVLLVLFIFSKVTSFLILASESP